MEFLGQKISDKRIDLQDLRDETLAEFFRILEEWESKATSYLYINNNGTSTLKKETNDENR